MPKHEEYEQLCALAMVGDASEEELYSLRRHLAECESCRREYREFSQLVLPQLWAMDDAIPNESNADIADTAELRESFLGRAQAQGISFSPEILKAPVKPTRARSVVTFPQLSMWYIAAMASCLVLLAVIGWRFTNRRPVQQVPVVVQVPVNVPAVPGVPPPAKPGPTVAELARLQTQQQELQRVLADLQAKLSAADVDRTTLNKQLEEKTTELAQLQASAAGSQQTVASLRDQIAALQTRADNREASYVADRVQINDLTDQLTRQRQAVDREQQMLAAGKDIRNMMAARNLHIVDVFDTDAKGRTNSAFGRVFFAEDKQLVFYAYDLNEKRLQNARYDYRIWGQREGQPQSAKSLGIFYSDDKTEHRWVFKYDDPKVLSEIDSVFVTLEPTNAAPEHPKGPQLMYAYLRGQANHP